MNQDIHDQATDFVRSQWPDARPAAGMILGSGWSDVVDAFTIHDTISYDKIPGLGSPGVVGHAGRLVHAEADGKEVFIFQGRRHLYEGEGWTPIALPVYLLSRFKVSALILTNAAGGIRDGFQPGDLMILDDHINFMHANPLTGDHNPVWGPRFPDQTEVYDAKLRDQLEQAAKTAGSAIHRGVYLATSGPTYETPAEIRSYHALGADAVGMSTVPEAMLGHSAGLRVVAMSCITNLAAGISPNRLTHEEVTDTTRGAMDRMKSVLLTFWKEFARSEG